MLAARQGMNVVVLLTVFQREVPEHAQSRVSSYDALGSLVLIPLSMAVVDPTAHFIGVSATLWIAAAVQVVCLAAIAAIPSVRAIRAPVPVASTA